MLAVEPKDYIESDDWAKHCLVCGKSVEQGGGLCHIKAEGVMIALCCPLCVETFNADPKHYLRLREMNKLRPPKSLG